MHRYRDGDIAILGMINDYAFLTWGLLELYESTFNVDYLKVALQLNNKLIEYFWDDELGGYFFTPKDSEEYIVRKKEIYDGAMPSGNSVAMLNLLRISRITANIDLEDKAVLINKAFSIQIEQSLLAHSMFLSGLEFAYGPTFEVVIVGKTESDDTRKMIKELREVYVPNKIVLFMPEDESEPEILKVTDFVKHKTGKDNKATAHVCINRFCKFPTNEIDIMLEMLKVNEK